jgi:hypothetical protein
MLFQDGWGANEGEVARAMPYASHVATSLRDAVTWI